MESTLVKSMLPSGRVYPVADFALLHSAFARQATACTVSFVPDWRLFRSQLRGKAVARISHECPPPETL